MKAEKAAIVAPDNKNELVLLFHGAKLVAKSFEIFPDGKIIVKL